LSAVVINYFAFGTMLSATQWVGMVLLSGTITVMGIAGERSEQGLGVRVETAHGALAQR
jgi:hypothetical protein